MPIVELTVVAAAAAAAGSLLWFTWRTGIAPVPSTTQACGAMLALMRDAPPGPVADLGSGWGTLAIACARRFPRRQVVGLELSWLPWAVSVLRARALGLHNLRFVRADFMRTELRGNAVLLCYLFGRGMRELARKLDDEAAWPSCLVSSTFALPGVRADRVCRLDDLYRTPVFLYSSVGMDRGLDPPLTREEQTP